MKRIVLRGSHLRLVNVQWSTRLSSRTKSQNRHPEGREAARRIPLAPACLPKTTLFLCDPDKIL